MVMVWWGGVGVLVGLTMGVGLLCLADEKLLLLSEVYCETKIKNTTYKVSQIDFSFFLS